MMRIGTRIHRFFTLITLKFMTHTVCCPFVTLKSRLISLFPHLLILLIDCLIIFLQAKQPAHYSKHFPNSKVKQSGNFTHQCSQTIWLKQIKIELNN